MHVYIYIYIYTYIYTYMVYKLYIYVFDTHTHTYLYIYIYHVMCSPGNNVRTSAGQLEAAYYELKNIHDIYQKDHWSTGCLTYFVCIDDLSYTTIQQ